MINLNHLNYFYGTFKALDDVSATINPGIHLLLGENGAGKTTLLHCIAGLRTASPTDSCMVNDYVSAERKPAMLCDTFILTDEMELPYDTLTEMVKYHACFYPSFSQPTLNYILERFGLSINDHISHLSLGNRKKAKLAYALSLKTSVLLLDEPANGLDILSKQALLEVLAETAGPENTIIISTHTVWDFQNLFEGLIVMRNGKIILSMPIWEITERLNFVSDNQPAEGSIFTLQNFGRFESIVPRTDNSIPAGDLDFLLLYTALQSAQLPLLLNHLNTPNQ